MKLEHKCIGFFIGPGYEELELWAVYMRLLEEGADVKVIGLKKGEIYSSKHGCLDAKADYGPRDVKSKKLDALVIPGGWAPDKLRRDSDLIQLMREMDMDNKIIAMICHAGLMGISAGIVKGKRATGSEGIKDDLINAGARWTDEAAFSDGNLVWGRVVEDIPAFNRELIRRLGEG